MRLLGDLPASPWATMESSRYELVTKIASGGMGTVYVGCLRGAAGFRRLVAIKRAHPHLLEDPRTREMLVAEARVASRIHHVNVVSVLDVEELEGEMLLVMDYVDGPSLAQLVTEGQRLRAPIPPAVALRIVLDACAGLEATHAATDENGERLGLVHRDVSPHNILVGVDGVAKLTDFGIAKATRDRSLTETGTLKGKIPYMAPEYLAGGRPVVSTPSSARRRPQSSSPRPLE